MTQLPLHDRGCDPSAETTLASAGAWTTDPAKEDAWFRVLDRG